MSDTTTTPTTLEQRREAMLAIHDAAAADDWATEPHEVDPAQALTDQPHAARSSDE